MKKAEFENTPIPASPENSFGQLVGGLIDSRRPMGSWTGLPSSFGAPLSGLLLGAGLGGVYGLGRMAWDAASGVQRPPRPWWKSPIALGGIGGLSLGLVSAIAQAKDRLNAHEAENIPPPSDYLAPPAADYLKPTSGLDTGGLKMAAFMGAQERANVKQIIANDPNIAYFEKQRLLGLVDQADGGQLKRLAALALGGALTAGVAHTVLGTGVFGSTLAGAAGSFFLSNLIPSGNRYV